MNSSHSNAACGPTKYQNLPKFAAGATRVVLSHSFDHSNITHDTFNRTVSGNLTMMSTPLNRRRTWAPPQKAASHLHTRKPDLPHPLSKKGRLIKLKLLNLTQLLKERVVLVRRDPLFVIHRPLPMAGYDYLAFAAAPIRESQVAAWQLAERVLKSLIFGSDLSSSDDDDSMAIDDDEPTVAPLPPISSAGTTLGPEAIIKAIPGYTKDELQVVLSAATEADAQRNVLEHKRRVHRHHEHIFAQLATVNHKRQVQIDQKREVYTRIFGDANRLNHEYITNNLFYLAIDNLADIHQLFHEDKLEVTSIVAEEKAFLTALAETAKLFASQHCPSRVEAPVVDLPTKQRRRSPPPIADDEVDYEKLQGMIARKLDSSYSRTVNDDVDQDEPDVSDISIEELNDELQGYVCRHLRARLRN